MGIKLGTCWSDTCSSCSNFRQSGKNAIERSFQDKIIIRCSLEKSKHRQLDNIPAVFLTFVWQQKHLHLLLPYLTSPHRPHLLLGELGKKKGVGRRGRRKKRKDNGPEGIKKQEIRSRKKGRGSQGMVATYIAGRSFQTASLSNLETKH